MSDKTHYVNSSEAALYPANKRKPIRIVLDPDAHPVAKGNLCEQQAGFNLHAATKIAANYEQGRLALCKYILRPPLANDRLKILDDSVVRLEFKKTPGSGRGRSETYRREPARRRAPISPKSTPLTAPIVSSR